MDQGRAVLALGADEARSKFQKIRARFSQAPPALAGVEPRRVRRDGREIEIIVNGDAESVLERVKAAGPETVSSESLTLEEIFVAALQ